MTQLVTRHPSLVTGRAWVLLVMLAAHSGWAMYPVLNKALLAYLPPFTLLMVANGLSAIIAFFIARPRLSLALFSNRSMWLFALITAARSITNILAIKYTLAIYVQLVNLSTPFYVAWMGCWLLKEKIPPYTFSALLVSSLGAFLVISPNPLALQLPHGSTDLLGIALALLSSAFLGLYMTWSRKMTTHDTHPTVVFFSTDPHPGPPLFEPQLARRRRLEHFAETADTGLGGHSGFDVDRVGRRGAAPNLGLVADQRLALFDANQLAASRRSDRGLAFAGGKIGQRVAGDRRAAGDGRGDRLSGSPVVAPPGQLWGVLSAANASPRGARAVDAPVMRRPKRHI